MSEYFTPKSVDPLPSNPTVEELIDNGIIISYRDVKSTLGEVVITDETPPFNFLKMKGFLHAQDSDERRGNIMNFITYLDKIHEAYVYAKTTNSVFDPMDDQTFVAEKGFDSLRIEKKDLCEEYIEYLREQVRPEGRHSKAREASQSAGNIALNAVSPLYSARTGWVIDNR